MPLQQAGATPCPDFQGREFIMRSKWLWAALALVAVLGITTAASATTRGLITGKQIASHKDQLGASGQSHDSDT